MRSVIKRMLLAMALVFMTSTMVWADAAIVFNAAAPVTVAQEFAGPDGLVKNFFSGDLGISTDTNVYLVGATSPGAAVYTANLGLNLDWTITFTLTSGTFFSDDLELWSSLADGGAPLLGTDTKVGELIDGGEGESFARFIITGGVDIPANQPLYLISAATNIGGVAPELGGFAIETAVTATGSIVTLAVTDVRTDGQVLVNTAKATAVDLLELVKQFEASVTTVGESIIDVAQDRMFFNDAAGWDTSTATITLVNNAPDDPYTLIATDEATLTLTSSGDLSAIDGITVAGEDFDAFLGTASVATVTLPLFGAGLLPMGASDIVITVAGDEVIKVRSFTSALSFDLPDLPNTLPILYTGDETFVWGINGWIGTVPYMYATAGVARDTSDSFIKIFNNSPIDADVSVTVTSDAGATAEVLLTAIPLGTVGIFWAGDIAAAAGFAPGTSFAAVFIVNAEKNDITAMANMKRGATADRQLPVYTGDTANTYKTY